MGLRTIIDAIISIAFTAAMAGTSWHLYKFIRYEALSKIQEPQPSLVEFTEKLTGKKSPY